MSWRFAKRLPRPGQVINVDDFNEALSELRAHQGSLNEHNFSTNMTDGLTIGDFESGVVTKVKHVYIAGAAVAAFEFDNSGTGQQAVNQTVGWAKVDALEATIVSDGAWYSFRWRLRVFTTKETLNMCEMMGAMTIDDAVITDSGLGNFDNDAEDEKMERGISGFRNQLQGTYRLFLSPGVHTIGLVVRLHQYKPRATRYPIAGVSGGSLFLVQETR